MQSGPKVARRWYGKQKAGAAIPAWPSPTAASSPWATPSTADDKDEYLLASTASRASRSGRLRPARPGLAAIPTWRVRAPRRRLTATWFTCLRPMACWFVPKTADRKERWRKDLKADFKGKKGDGWGYSESVLIDGDN